MYLQQLMRKNLFSAAPIDTIVEIFYHTWNQFLSILLASSSDQKYRHTLHHIVSLLSLLWLYHSLPLSLILSPTLSHSLSHSLSFSVPHSLALSRTLGLINGNRNNLDLLLRPHKQSMRVGQIILLYNRCYKIGQRCPFISKISF